MNLNPDLTAIGHDSYVAGYDSTYLSLLGSIHDFMHRRDVIGINYCVDCEVGLHTCLVTDGSYFLEVVDGKSVGTMGTHVEFAYAEIY